MEPLVVAWLAFGIALAALCGTLYAIARPPRDSDVEELADELAKLARRARADTMRRVRQEARGVPQDGEAGIEAPPQLKGSLPPQTPQQDPRAMKHAIRKRLLGEVH